MHVTYHAYDTVWKVTKMSFTLFEQYTWCKLVQYDKRISIEKNLRNWHSRKVFKNLWYWRYSRKFISRTVWWFQTWPEFDSSKKSRLLLGHVANQWFPSNNTWIKIGSSKCFHMTYIWFVDPCQFRTKRFWKKYETQLNRICLDLNELNKVYYENLIVIGSNGYLNGKGSPFQSYHMNSHRRIIKLF